MFSADLKTIKGCRKDSRREAKRLPGCPKGAEKGAKRRPKASQNHNKNDKKGRAENGRPANYFPIVLGSLLASFWGYFGGQNR